MSIRQLLSTWLPTRHDRNSEPQAQFQILSDLHLEVCQQYHTFQIPVHAPNLVLAGDIGRLVDYDSYLHFLSAQTAVFDRVFLVLGNHEFYGLSFDEGIARARQLEIEPVLSDKLVLLHQREWNDEDSDVTVLGCTLWSYIPPELEDITAKMIKDFKHIRGWTVHSHRVKHVSDLEWLRARLKSAAKDKRTALVVTHHAPCLKGTSDPKHANNPWSVAFATALYESTSEWRKSGVGCWVFGHTHYTNDMVKGGVRIMSNQRGYVFPGSKEETYKKSRGELGLHDFDVGKVIDL